MDKESKHSGGAEKKCQAIDNRLRGIVAEPHKWCGTDFLDLASLDPLWNTPSWDIKNGILEKFFLHSGGLAQLIF